MRRRTALSLCLLLLPCLAATSPAGTLTTDLTARYAAAAPGAELPVIVRFQGAVSPRRFAEGARSAPALIGALRSTSARSQSGARALLEARGLAARATELWIVNGLALAASADIVDELAALPDVESVEYDEPVSGAFGPPETEPVSVLSESPVWSLIKVNVPAVWSLLGLTGAGVTVGSMDTGVDITHPALAGKWRGGTNSWKDLVGGLASPYDNHGHGTHTIGTMVGGDAGGPFAPDIGVAPGAQFVSCKVLDATNSFSSASIVIAGAQWMLDPDGNPATNDFPQVINNSWFFNSQTYTGFRPAVEAWLAAGIIPVFCLANFGPSAASTRPPGSYDDVIGVGAIDSLSVVASFSSRGPSPVGAGFPLDQRKPEISAPGVLVTSSLPFGAYGDWNGTSMATPAVAGTVALLLQAYPGISYADVRNRLISSAVDIGAPGFDYDTGYGRLDAYGAVMAAVGVPPAAGGGARALRAWPLPARGPVQFALPAGVANGATLEVFDVHGRRVWSTRISAGVGAGWDARDAPGTRAPAGLYLARLTDGGTVWHGRVLLLD